MKHHFSSDFIRFHQVSSDFIRFHQIFFLEKNCGFIFPEGCHQKNGRKKTPTAISNLTIPFLKGCDPKELQEKTQQSHTCRLPFSRVVTQNNWKKKTTQQSQTSPFPFSKVFSQKNWKKKKHTAISNLTIPFLKGCDPK